MLEVASTLDSREEESKMILLFPFLFHFLWFFQHAFHTPQTPLFPGPNIILSNKFNIKL